ncbi:unnamed protein product [Allacma fusca]|uniref:HAT C-terminal dimerisation domain-containing protein n=1 Tax=Allacma fusca TaxID=39272 RepID=A0A8J2LK05_9HEXA|nr:unnamed protein product [Allacma fusca]
MTEVCIIAVELPEPYKLNQCMPKIEKIKNVLTKAFEKEKQLAAEVIEIQQGELEAVNVPSVSKRTKVDFLASFIPEDGETTLPELKNEVDEYLKEPRLSIKSNPLEFWKQCMEQKKYPILCRMAKKYLGYPASSSSIERVFSITGSLNRARRARLATKTIEGFLVYREYRKEELGIDDKSQDKLVCQQSK